MGQFNVIDAGYTHVQSTEATTWNIQHNRGRNVVIDVYITVDGTQQKILPLGVTLVDLNNATVTFSTARSGMARVA